MSASHVVLSGNKHRHHSSVRRLRDVEAGRPLSITVAVRGPVVSDTNDVPFITLAPKDFSARYGADPQDLALVGRVLAGYGLTVDASSPITRLLQLSGPASAMNAAFQVNLGIYSHHEAGEIMSHDDEVFIPSELDNIITGVFGLDRSPVVRRRPSTAKDTRDEQQLEELLRAALTPAQVEKRYNFPAGDGNGQKIGIAEFGGVFDQQKMDTFCSNYNITPPQITIWPENFKNIMLSSEILSDDDMVSDTIESMMDVEIIGSLCPKSDIIMYFGLGLDDLPEGSEKPFIDVIHQAIQDQVNVLSISWGLAEDDVSYWPELLRNRVNDLLAIAARMGINVLIAAGDDGSGDQMNDGACHIDFPSSSPFVLSVGGTMIKSQQEPDTEVTWWNAPGARAKNGGSTGGGMSVYFERPSWQQVSVESLNPNATNGRVIPDVAALAGYPGYQILAPETQLGGPLRDEFGNPVWGMQPGEGTSAAAPVWAALIARVNALLPQTQQRFLGPLLYGPGPDGKPLGMSVCNDITEGDNHIDHVEDLKFVPGYKAGPGYDAVTGWGTPNGQALLEALKQS